MKNDMILSAAQAEELNLAFTNFVFTNPHLRNKVEHHSLLIRSEGSGLYVFVNLDMLPKPYKQKFITGKLNDYANGLLSKLNVILLRFLERNQIDEYVFSFHFLHNHVQSIKTLRLVCKA